MTIRQAVQALLVWSLLGAAAQADTNNLWVMWENIPGEKPAQSHYRSHLMFNVPQTTAEDFFYALIPSARRYGNANVAHEKSPLCMALDPPEPATTSPLQVDEASLEIADKVATLRGLNGVFVDLRGVRGPPGYRANFGEDAHAYVLRAFADAGIPVLTREEMENAPGRPALKLRYSAEVVGCRPWAIYLSLTQTVVLTRDTTIMLEVPTWNTAKRQSEEDVAYGAYDALEDAVGLFITDYLTANPVEPSRQALRQ